MKKNYYRTFIYIIIVLLTLSLSNILCVNAESEKYDTISSETFTADEIDIETVIQQCYNQEGAEWYFSAQFEDDPRAEQCWVSPSIFVIEHVLSNQFVNNPDTFSDGAINEQMFNEYPIVYFPFFMNLDGTDRIIGHLKLYFNALKGKYTYTGSFIDYDSIEFQQGEPVHFIEKLVSSENLHSIAAQHNVNGVQQIILARHWSAYTDYSDKVVVLEASDGLHIYDFTDAGHVDSKMNKPPVMYSYSEYVELRSEYEQMALQSISDSSQIVAGGAVFENSINTSSKLSKSHFVNYIVVFFIVVIPILIIVILKKKKKN
ncbi:MAG: hypothetical protein J6A50_00645 [Clostridia bacterium]|nr:hypothetical protein [Clostridia bacterium]